MNEDVCPHCGCVLERKNRSRQTHNHFFAQVEEGWMTLPEVYRERLRTAEHLRKWALIKAGFRKERSVIFSTPGDAQRGAVLVQIVDDYCVVSVDGCIVTIYTAMSQQELAMDKAQFQASKQAVFDVIAQLLGVPSFGDDTYSAITFRPRRSRKQGSERRAPHRNAADRERKGSAA